MWRSWSTALNDPDVATETILYCYCAGKFGLPGQTVFLSGTSQVVHGDTLDVGRGLNVVRVRHKIRQT